MGRLDGRIAVITGSTRGIGLATAKAFAREGARVVVCSRKQEGVDAATEEINAEYPGMATGIPLHVGRLDTLSEFFDRVQDEVGVVDTLVNNAGTNPHFGPMLQVEWGAWDKTFDVNLKGPFEMTRQMVMRLDGKPGSVVNVSSIMGLRAELFQGVYSCTKSAMIMMTMSLATEFGQFGIPVRVNAVAPGIIDTKLSAAISNNEEIKKRVLDHTPLKRMGEPEEIAELILFLSSDDASFITGSTMTADGGYTVV